MILAASTTCMNAFNPLSHQETSLIWAELLGRRGVPVRGGLLCWDLSTQITNHNAKVGHRITCLDRPPHLAINWGL